jgi:hypothetical protein
MPKVPSDEIREGKTSPPLVVIYKVMGKMFAEIALMNFDADALPMQTNSGRRNTVFWYYIKLGATRWP